MAAPTKEEMKKIMQDPESPEREVYDKMLKNNPLFKAEKKIKKHLKDKIEKKNKKKAGGRIKMAGGGSMPDLSGDGEVTQKDVLIGRGVIKKKAGGKVKAKKMKKCRMDGIAIRGKTRAKQRSK